MGKMLVKILLLMLTLQVGYGAKVLFFMGLATHSVRVAIQPLAAELGNRGHEVTVLTHIPAEDPHPNVTDFFPNALRSLLDGALDQMSVICVQGRLNQKHFDTFVNTYTLYEMSLFLQEACVRDSEFQEWIKTSKFDLIIYDSPLKELAVGIAYKMNAKVITFSTTATHWMHEFETFGLPAESSWLPDFSQGGSQHPLIPDHFMYAYMSLKTYYWFMWDYLPKLDAMLEELYEEKLPPVSELVKKVDLVLVNEHFSYGFPRALPPFVIPVGGMHVKESNGKLPKDLEAFVATKKRFVLVSFGSGLKISDLPPDTRDMFLNTLEAMSDTNFLLKWNAEVPQNLSSNILAKKWFPQQDVLAHPKCKGFLTQGGAMSYTQAIYHAVPMIFVPIWGDQEYVVRTAVQHDVGIWLELSEITKETLTNALRDVLDTDRYINNVKDASKRFRDRPLSSIDTAAYWTEYVLRHDSSHLKPPGVQQYWWQRRLLDFWLCVLGAVLLVLFISFKVLSVLVRVIFKSISIEKVKQS